MALEITGRGIALRDFTLADLPARIRWDVEETEWQQWDAPWEHDEHSPQEAAAQLAEFRTRLNALAQRNMALQDSDTRLGFEVYTLDPRRNIGWVNSYCLSDTLDYSPLSTHRRAVGIDLPPRDCRGKGYGKAALGLFISYLLERGHTSLFTQTWSGNTPMLGLARSLGFEECRRLAGARQVRGQAYDALTLALNAERFRALWQG